MAFPENVHPSGVCVAGGTGVLVGGLGVYVSVGGSGVFVSERRSCVWDGLMVAVASIGFVVADGFVVSDGSAGFMVSEGEAVLPGTETVGELIPRVKVIDGVEDGSSVITTSLVFSDSVGSSVVVRVRFLTTSSPGFFTGMLVHVYVALIAKGVNVDVPPANLLTIFVFELQATVDNAKRTKMISITEQRLCIIR